MDENGEILLLHASKIKHAHSFYLGIDDFGPKEPGFDYRKPVGAAQLVERLLPTRERFLVRIPSLI